MARTLIKPVDASLLLTDRGATPAHVAALAVCSPPDGESPSFLGELVAAWRERRDFAAPFNYHLRLVPLLSWEELDPDQVDLDYHLRHSALPRPGGERELGVLISRLHSHPLDHHRPLWELHVIEGLEGDRFALYLKLHHMQFDGVAGVRFFQRFLSAQPGAGVPRPPWEVGFGAPRLSGEADGQQRGGIVRDVVGGIRSLPAIARSSGGLALEMLARRQPELALPFGAPTSPLNGRIQAARRFATQLYEFDRVRALADASGATINDVFLAVCAGALRRYLGERGELPDRTLTAGLPMSVRPAGDTELGNAITFIQAKLYTDEADPLARLEAIHRSTTAAKTRLEGLPRPAIDAYTLLVFGPYLGQLGLGLGGIGPPFQNVVVSNVPGPSEPLHLGGARIDELYGLPLLFNGQALSISILSYGGRFNVGFMGCRDSLPHMQHIAVHAGEALAELEEALIGSGYSDGSRP